MKISIILSFICTLLATSSIQARTIDNEYNDEFANPLFNQPLSPLSKKALKTQLSPQGIFTQNNPHPADKIFCRLILNKVNHITYICRETNFDIYVNDDIDTYNFYNYYLSPCIKETGCPYRADWMVSEYKYNLSDQLLDTTYYLIK